VSNKQGSITDSLRQILRAVLVTASLLVAGFAQNPVPQIIGPVKPMAVAPGSGAFTLTVYGANCVPGAVVNWNYQPRSTTFVSAHELQAQILATDIARNTAGLISVTNPAPGGGNSSASWAQVEVHAPVSTINLSPPQQYPIGDWLLMAADFNHDGILDLVGEYGSDLELYAGSGHGSFHFVSVAGRNYTGVLPGVYGDFNGDGNIDLIFPQGTQTYTSTQMAVMLGDGKGKFHLGSRILDNELFALTVVGDFNQDGKLDLITRGSQLSLFLGNGDGTFTHSRNYPYSDLVGQMIVGDFNGDGKLDLVLYRQPLPNNGNLGIGLYVALGNGDGTFQRPRLIHSFPNGSGCGASGVEGDVQLSDFNGDGKLDLAICTQSQIIVLMGNGDGTFQPPVSYDAGRQQQFTFAIGDINSDGKPDLLVSQYYDFNNPRFAVLLGNGDGTFRTAQGISAPEAELGIILGDFNADGLLDCVFQTSHGSDAFMQQ
jgi:hypothetical protein